MSGVWVFKNGVVRLVENPGTETLDGGRQASNSGRRNKVLVHTPSNEVITSYSVLERKLLGLGWERYYNDPDLLQFHIRSTVHLISLPKDFTKFKSMHMYDIVVKNRNCFEVRDM
ncbi:flowering-promoting factor 1-like protein 3 [Telopea speciosissima]|uniref:flowering-promoting factor 1-like protein 3 n=1 Tax=Telopea speciosissima TaxID=54955 RepID=UPI001CC81904|nr:flowering-promoting factor 1-like protein 3 [Telopea speciosissima]